MPGEGGREREAGWPEKLHEASPPEAGEWASLGPKEGGVIRTSSSLRQCLASTEPWHQPLLTWRQLERHGDAVMDRGALWPGQFGVE